MYLCHHDYFCPPSTTDDVSHETSLSTSLLGFVELSLWNDFSSLLDGNAKHTFIRFWGDTVQFVKFTSRGSNAIHCRWQTARPCPYRSISSSVDAAAQAPCVAFESRTNVQSTLYKHAAHGTLQQGGSSFHMVCSTKRQVSLPDLFGIPVCPTRDENRRHRSILKHGILKCSPSLAQRQVGHDNSLRLAHDEGRVAVLPTINPGRQSSAATSRGHGGEA